MRFLVLTLLLTIVSGCASQAALNQPEKKDLSVLEVGNSRDNIILELGAPANTEINEAGRVDLFSIVQGYSHGVRAARAIAHGTAELFTLGAWSLVGAQVEESYNGQILGFRVTYDKEDKVTSVEKLLQKDRN